MVHGSGGDLGSVLPVTCTCHGSEQIGYPIKPSQAYNVHVVIAGRTNYSVLIDPLLQAAIMQITDES